METELGIRRASNIPITLLFSDDEKLRGATICGEFLSTYQARERAMGFPDAEQLPRNCASPIQALQLQDYYGQLKDVLRFTADLTQLKLFTRNNSTLVYERGYEKCHPSLDIMAPPLSIQRHPGNPLEWH